MLRITVKFGDPLRQAIGQRRITLEMPEGSTAADLMTVLKERYPDFEKAFRGDALGRVAPYIFFINHHPVTSPNYAATTLGDGDTVHLVLPVAGGSNV